MNIRLLQLENQLLMQFHEHLSIELGRQFWVQCAIELRLCLEDQIDSIHLGMSIWAEIRGQLESQLLDQIMTANNEFTAITT